MLPERFDAVVVGAGPYGLSAAAHLRGMGLRVAIFGKPLELWLDHMPRGMMLRSQCWAANLSDPDRRYTFPQFFRESGRPSEYPVPLDTFVEYARWFQVHAVPVVDETYVAAIDRHGEGFLVTLEDGRQVESTSVVMAVGLRYYAHLPSEFRGLPASRVSHSSELRELDRFRGQRVVVIGGGQSAVEYAALVHEAGGTVDLVCRHPIVWLERDRFGERGVLERLRAPDTGIGPGWKNWVLEHLPYVFYRMPRSWKERAMEYYSGAWAADWLRARIFGKVTLHEGCRVVSTAVRGTAVELTLSDGTVLSADHVILATGYQPDIGRIPLLAPRLRAAVKAEEGVPSLDPYFETTVPGLYFIGATSLREFGPIFRFVLGCRPAATRVARSIALRQSLRRSGAPARQEGRGTPDLGRPAWSEALPASRPADDQNES